MKVKVGVEKECLIFDKAFNPIDIDLDQLPPQLKVDFANHQLEVVTDPMSSSLIANQKVRELLSLNYFKQYKVWPLSSPMKVNNDVAHDKLDKEYRDYLADKYGIEKMLYSGIHYNYSNDLLSTKEEYFQLIQNVYEYLPIIMQFTSFTPRSHNLHQGLSLINKDYGLGNAISLRASSDYGFVNCGGVDLNFDSYKQYLNSKQELVNGIDILDEREIYSKLRLKEYKGENYIELRFIDINPFEVSGISDQALIFIESCLAYLSKYKVKAFNTSKTFAQIDQVALHGLDRSIKLDIEGEVNSLTAHTNKLLDILIKHSQTNVERDALENIKVKYNKQMLDIDLMVEKLSECSLQQFGEEYAYEYSKFEMLYPELDMELSTKLLIKAAKDNGYDVSIESETQNIIKISNQERNQYVVQATKTNLDGYASVLLMNDKYMTKKILAENNICVPHGHKLKKGDKLVSTLNGLVVVKPLDTNFGLGITICNADNNVEFNQAIELAFTYSDEIIIEKYYSGSEYRLLVIDGVCESIVTRYNANVIGDGTSTIEELIKLKNESPLRSRGYKTPLEMIDINQELKRVVSRQGYDLSSILKLGQKVLLSDTSNVSQGGDSHEVFDRIPESFKKEAVLAAEALGVKICGIDMIIDFEKGEHAIIEANFNPALHMHMFPYMGRGRDVATKVLAALFKE